MATATARDPLSSPSLSPTVRPPPDQTAQTPPARPAAGDAHLLTTLDGKAALLTAALRDAAFVDVHCVALGARVHVLPVDSFNTGVIPPPG